jgi:PKD repeat protein
MRTTFFRVLLALVSTCNLAGVASAQGTYSNTLPNLQGSGLTSWTAITFPSTPNTFGEGTITFSWLACYQGGFGTTGVQLEIRTGTSAYTSVLNFTGGTLSCSFQNRTVIIPAALMQQALAYTGGASVQARIRVNDACQPGVGCSFYNDPVVQNLTLAYTVVSANFTSPDASICPGGVVQFNDASLNVPTSYAWSFPGGTPDTSNIANPVVQYSAPGTYPVTLEVTTADGPSTVTRPTFVTVYNLPNAFAGLDQTVCAGANAQLQASGGSSYQWIPATGLSSATIANPIATLTNSATYTVIVTSSQGCEASDAVLLTVTPLPQIGIQSEGTAICGTDTVGVTVSGASLYTWSPNLFISSNTGASVQVWPPATFSWTVTGTDLNGCVGTNTLEVTVSPAPTTPVITWADMILSSSASEEYQWYLDGAPIPDATEQDYTPLVNGTYTVVTTDANGCIATSAPYFFGSTSVPVASPTQLSIYPQPVSDVLNVVGLEGDSRYRLIDGQGRLVQEGRLPGPNAEIDVRASAPGMYVLHVISPDGGHSEHRIIKQ